MGIIVRLKNIAAGIRLANKRGFESIADLDKMMDEKVFGRPAASGVVVNTDTAVAYSAWFNGCQQISQTAASLPCIVYKQENNTKRHYKELPLYNVLKRKTNIRTDAYLWKEVTQYHLLSWGNSYSYIQRDAGMRPIGLWLLNPDGMRKIYVMEDGSLQYEFRDEKKGTKIYTQDEILHIRGFGFDGIRGYSILTLARETIGLGLSQQEFLARFYGQGTNVGGYLEHPTSISPIAQRNLTESFKKEYSGLQNAWKVILLEEGIKFNKTMMPLVDAQFLELCIFTVQDVARWLNISPDKLKDLSKATYSNIEFLGASFYKDTMRPWLERQESAMDMQLLTGDDAETAYIEYDINAIMRADIKTRNETYDIQRRNGVLNADEWRDAENMNPIGEEHGKIYTLPANFIDAAKMTEKSEEPPPEEPKQADKVDIDNIKAKGELNAI